MPLHVKSSEVVHYLKNYGIEDIDNASLQHFIKDLKKLIKYEERRYQNTLSDATKSSRTNITTANNVSPSRNIKPSTCKDENRQKRFENEENICPSNKDVQDRCCPCSRKNKTLQDNSNSSNIQSRKNDTPEIKCSNTLKSNDEKSCKCKFSKEKDKKTFTNSVNENSKVKPHDPSRPASLIANARSNVTKGRKQNPDPVELYHYYQSIWKCHKLPGEDDRAQLRREIRNRLMKVK